MFCSIKILTSLLLSAKKVTPVPRSVKIFTPAIAKKLLTAANMAHEIIKAIKGNSFLRHCGVVSKDTHGVRV